MSVDYARTWDKSQSHEIPIQRNDRDLLFSIADNLVAVRSLLERLVSTDRSGAVSSVTVKYTSATKDLPSKPAPEIKLYTGSDADVDGAVEAYGRAVLLLEQAQLDGWAATVERLSNR